MSNSSRFALRAFRCIQSNTRPQPERFTSHLLREPQPAAARPFCAYSKRQAQAASPPATPSSTANASATENSLKTDPAPAPLNLNENDPTKIDWSRSYHGLGNEAFPKEAADILLAPLNEKIVEIKPDGIVFLPEIHYRRILNKAFGPGAWGLAPRGETIVTDKAVTREYALIAHGRLVSIARGEQDYFSKDGIPTASEGCKSNAMVRCCKDLGIASELWDPRFIRMWKAKYAKEVFVEHQVTKKRTKHWLRKEDSIAYPYKETSGAASSARKVDSGSGY